MRSAKEVWKILAETNRRIQESSQKIQEDFAETDQKFRENFLNYEREKKL